MQYTVLHWTSFSILTNLKLDITRPPEVRLRKYKKKENHQNLTPEMMSKSNKKANPVSVQT